MLLAPLAMELLYRIPSTHPFTALTPEAVLDAIAAIGLRPDGRLLGLNSYENRVYQVWLEEDPPVVVKFYRPGRWSEGQIREEHEFATELLSREIPVVAPAVFNQGTLQKSATDPFFHFAIYPRRGGRSPNLEDPKVLEWIGRFIGRIDAVGGLSPFKVRPSLDLKTFGQEPREWLLKNASIPADVLDSWKAVTEQALFSAARSFEHAGKVRTIRLHGDCHPGNILWTDDGPHFVDLDDARMGPAVQGLWLLLSRAGGPAGAPPAGPPPGHPQIIDLHPPPPPLSPPTPHPP